MGFFKAIVSGAKAVLGFREGSSKSQDNVMEVARGVGTWIDNQQYTDQEKAEDAAAVSASLITFLQTTVGENTQRSLTRRNIAIWIIRCEIWFFVMSAITYPLNERWSEYLFKIAGFDTPMGWATMTVLIFFFGNYALRTIQGRS